MNHIASGESLFKLVITTLTIGFVLGVVFSVKFLGAL